MAISHESLQKKSMYFALLFNHRLYSPNLQDMNHFIQNLKKLYKTVRAQTIKDASQLCSSKRSHAVFELFDDNFTDSSIFSKVGELAPSFADTFVWCKFFDKWTDCDKLLYPTMTENGICYTFNALNMYELVTDQ